MLARASNQCYGLDRICFVETIFVIATPQSTNQIQFFRARATRLLGDSITTCQCEQAFSKRRHPSETTNRQSTIRNPVALDVFSHRKSRAANRLTEGYCIPGLLSTAVPSTASRWLTHHENTSQITYSTRYTTVDTRHDTFPFHSQNKAPKKAKAYAPLSILCRFGQHGQPVLSVPGSDASSGDVPLRLRRSLVSALLRCSLRYTFALVRRLEANDR